VETVADLWAMERGGAFRGRYHVLGGVLSALDGVTPEALRIPELVARVRQERGAGGHPRPQRDDRRADDGPLHRRRAARRPAVGVTSLAQGVPIGGELDYLDDGTIAFGGGSAGATAQPRG
jgi:recombination protein RecR